jgi:cobalt-zinc-cadmium resistance protein CzcA
VLNAVIGWSLRHRAVVMLIWAGVAAAGIHAFARLPMDAFPDTTPVQVTINTPAPQLGPLEAERQITMPVEQAIAGLRGLSEVRSISKFGLSQVTAIFEDGVDIYLARQLVMERISALELPAGIEKPTLGPVATGLGEVFHYLVTGEGETLSELRTIQDWTIKPQLRTVPGVAEVNTWGGDERQIHVVVDPTKLMKHDLSLRALIEAIEENNENVGGGMLVQSGEAAVVQGIGLVTTPAQLEAIVVTSHEGVPIRVRDVATVVDGSEIRRGAVSADGTGEVVLGLGFMLMGENSHDVTRALEVRLATIQKTLPEHVKAEIVYTRTSLVDRVLRTVEKNLLEGALLVIAVLFIFLGNLRAGLIVASAIPLSMLFAFDLMLRFGIAGSLMSLGAIDFGLVVDSSVIQVENAVRRLSEAKEGERPVDVVMRAAIEVRKPTMFGELIIMIVYLPILTLGGIEGKMFRPMALTVIFALVGSMLLSLTLVPALSSFGLSRRQANRGHHENLVVRTIKRFYAPLLRGALSARALVLSIAAVAFLNGVFIATRLGSEFIPRLREGSLVINTVRLASISLEESVRYGTMIERTLLDRFPDEIERVWTRTGTAEVATDPMGLELSDVFITLTDRSRWTKAGTQDELVVALQETLDGFPGMRAVMTQPIEMRVNEMVAGVRSDVGVKVFGDDIEVLKHKGKGVETLLKSIPGAADVTIEQVTGAPVLQIEVDRDAIARHGISVREVLDVVRALGTLKVGEMQEGERRFQVTVRIADSYRTNVDALGRVLVAAENGDRVPLKRLATLKLVEGPSTINREWGKRRIVVQANVRDRDVGSFVEEAVARVDEDLALPPGYYVRFGGQFEHMEDATARLMIVVPLALALIFALLYFTYGRLLDAVRVFIDVPLAAVGGGVSLWLRDIPFSVSAAVGFIALSGVCVLGDMVLVSTVKQKLAEGLDLRTAVEQSALERMRPVLMTALVAAIGFLPMALNTGIGAEVQRPLATVVIGGVLSSTLLTLVVQPVLYLVLARFFPNARGDGAAVAGTAPATSASPSSESNEGAP